MRIVILLEEVIFTVDIGIETFKQIFLMMVTHIISIVVHSKAFLFPSFELYILSYNVMVSYLSVWYKL